MCQKCILLLAILNFKYLQQSLSVQMLSTYVIFSFFNFSPKKKQMSREKCLFERNFFLHINAQKLNLLPPSLHTHTLI